MAAVTPKAGRLLLLAVVLCGVSSAFGFTGGRSAAIGAPSQSLANLKDFPDYEDDLPPLDSSPLTFKRKSKNKKNKQKKKDLSLDESLNEAAWGTKKHHISIYIESLCPGSRKLMKILKKIVTKHPDKIGELYINVRGFVKEHPLPGGDFAFSCQNGVAECVANLILNCASFYATSHKQYIDFALCVMSSSYPPLAAEDCAPQTGLSYDQINSCSTSAQGRWLLHQAGLKQQQLKPRMKYAPWILFNGVHVDKLPTCL